MGGMQRILSTVIAVVGEHAGAMVESLGAAANVRTARPDAGRAPLERAVAAWSEATGSRSPYLLHDAGPLAGVAAAWVRRYDEQGPAGELELAVSETVLRWRAKAIDLPTTTWSSTRAAGRRPGATGTSASCTGPRRAGSWSPATSRARRASASPTWARGRGGRTSTTCWRASTGSCPTGCSTPFARLRHLRA
jgi:hypothetical protein